MLDGPTQSELFCGSVTVKPHIQGPAAFAIEYEQPVPSQAEAYAVVDADGRGVRHDHADELIGDVLNAQMNDRRRTQWFDDLDPSVAVGIGRRDQRDVVGTNADADSCALDARHVRPIHG